MKKLPKKEIEGEKFERALKTLRENFNVIQISTMCEAPEKIAPYKFNDLFNNMITGYVSDGDDREDGEMSILTIHSGNIHNILQRTMSIPPNKNIADAIRNSELNSELGQYHFLQVFPDPELMPTECNELGGHYAYLIQLHWDGSEYPMFCSAENYPENGNYETIPEFVDNDSETWWWENDIQLKFESLVEFIRASFQEKPQIHVLEEKTIIELYWHEISYANTKRKLTPNDVHMELKGIDWKTKTKYIFGKVERSGRVWLFKKLTKENEAPKINGGKGAFLYIAEPKDDEDHHYMRAKLGALEYVLQKYEVDEISFRLTDDAPEDLEDGVFEEMAEKKNKPKKKS